MQQAQFYSRFSSQEILYKLQNPHEIISQNQIDDVAKDIAQTNEIQLNLKKQDQEFKDDEKLKKKRKKLVQELRQIVIDWIKEYNPQDFQGDLLVLGSFKIETNSRNGDIDTCVLAPSSIKREQHFFGRLFEKLKSNSDVGFIYTIQEAMVPLIKFQYKGISIDMIFAQTDHPGEPLSQSIPYDEKSQNSLDGVKVAEYFSINYGEQEKFRIVVKAVKLWAYQRGIYRGVMGYLGGKLSLKLISSSFRGILEYFSCKNISTVSILFDQSIIGTILFHIQLMDMGFANNAGKRIYQQQQLERQLCRKQQYFVLIDQNQKGPMTILTPISPFINSSHSVSMSTLKIIQQQFYRAWIILQKIKVQECEWKSLFKKLPFFDIYPQYLEIRALAKCEQELDSWKGHVESKLRKLTKFLEDPNYLKYFEAHLYPFSFKRNYLEGENDEVGKEFRYGESFYYGLKINNQMLNMLYDGSLKIQNIGNYFCCQLEGSQAYLIVPESLSIQIQVLKNNQIPFRVRKQL